MEVPQPALLQVALCEPLTDLQRRGEFVSYSELLDQVRCLTRTSAVVGEHVLQPQSASVAAPQNCSELAQAAEQEAGSLHRLLLVTAYAVSVYSCVQRTWAPFRSPTGETCELVDEERGIRALGEKASAPWLGPTRAASGPQLVAT